VRVWDLKHRLSRRGGTGGCVPHTVPSHSEFNNSADDGWSEFTGDTSYDIAMDDEYMFEAGAVLEKNILGGLAPQNFPSPPILPTPFPSLPPGPLNFPSHPCPLPLPSFPFPPRSPFLFPDPFLPLPVPFSFSSLPSP